MIKGCSCYCNAGGCPVHGKRDTPDELLAFRGAYGRLCTLAAYALKQQGVSKEAVRIALAGDGNSVQLRAIRDQRARCNKAGERAKAVLFDHDGMTEKRALETLVAMAHEARASVQSEWGHSSVPGDEVASWDHLAIPKVNVK